MQDGADDAMKTRRAPAARGCAPSARQRSHVARPTRAMKATPLPTRPSSHHIHPSENTRKARRPPLAPCQSFPVQRGAGVFSQLYTMMLCQDGRAARRGEAGKVRSALSPHRASSPHHKLRQCISEHNVIVVLDDGSAKGTSAAFQAILSETFSLIKLNASRRTARAPWGRRREEPGVATLLLQTMRWRGARRGATPRGAPASRRGSPRGNAGGRDEAVTGEEGRVLLHLSTLPPAQGHP